MVEILIELLVVMLAAGALLSIRWLNKRRRVPTWIYIIVALFALWGGLFITTSGILGAQNATQVAGGILAATAIVILSVVLRTEVEIREPVFAKLFGTELAKKLSEGELRMPTNRELNSKAFNRLARILRAFGNIETEVVEQKVIIKSNYLDNFLLYDYDVTIRYATGDLGASQAITLKLEVHPYREVRVASERLPLPWGVPLQYERPEDKWPGKFFVPLLDRGDSKQWDSVVEQWNSLVTAIRPPTCAVTDLESTSQPEPAMFVGPEYHEEPGLAAKYVVFTANIRLGGRRKIALRYSLTNVPHPTDYFWMAWYAADLITAHWTLEISSESPVLRDVLCVSTYEDIRAEVQGKGVRHLRVTLEPRGNLSIIMPHDCILVSLDPSVMHMDPSISSTQWSDTSNS